MDLGPGHDLHDGIDRQPVNYDQISPNMLKAIVAIEDDRFWQHGALDVKGTIRALVNDLEHKPIQGGSTLEQQYVKNVLILQALDNPAAQQAATADTLSRKLDQLRMAVEVAHSMSKQEILAGYLNDSYYGNGAWGIETAAETYFNTTAAKLTMAQAATLAGIVEDPSLYDPIANPVQALTRRNTVLARIAHDRPRHALGLGRQPRSGRRSSGCTRAPGRAAAPRARSGEDAFFCDYVIHTILLDPQLGATPEDRAKLLSTGGLQIHTTLAPQDEAAATKAVNYVLPVELQYLQPGEQRRHRGARSSRAPARCSRSPRTGSTAPAPEGQTEVDYAVNTPVRRRRRRADRIVVQAVHAASPRSSRACPSATSATVPGTDDGQRLLQLRRASPRALFTRGRTPRARARAPTRCTRAPPSRSTSSTPTLSRRWACATWCTPRSTWA